MGLQRSELLLQEEEVRCVGLAGLFLEPALHQLRLFSQTPQKTGHLLRINPRGQLDAATEEARKAVQCAGHNVTVVRP